MQETSKDTNFQRAFLDGVEEFVRAVRPREDEIEGLGKLGDDIVEDMAARGLFGMLLPPLVGGLGLDLDAAARAMMWIGTTHPAVRVALSGTNGLAGAILAEELGRLEGDSRQRARRDMIRSWLEQMASGRMRAALAMSEPVGGSRLELHRTRATVLDDRWILDGFKAPVTEGGLIGLALVLAVTEPQAPIHRRFSLFAVQRNEFEVKWQQPTWVSRAQLLAGLSFDHVALPRERILGRPGHGLSVVSSALAPARLLMSASAVGACRRLLSEAVLNTVGMGFRWGGTASADMPTARGTRLADLDSVQVRLGRMAGDLAAARAVVERAVRLFDELAPDRGKQNLVRSPENRDLMAGRRLVQWMASAAKIHVSEIAGRLADDALDLLGADVLLANNSIGLFLRQARMFPLVEGSSAVLKKTLAKSLVETAARSAQRSQADSASMRQARFDALSALDSFFDGL